ncbi:MAG TPA: efflux RND transporter permease subunit, partial [Segetibacter sp.]|nr:efflux RND transporter permease subunit [Segetibacter sp.]
FYPGAGAEVVARAVATPIEEAINGVEDMSYMTSTSNNDGSMSLNIFFKLGTDPDKASVNVQNRVARAASLLPQEVIQAGITTQKQQNSMIIIPVLYTNDSAYDETFLTNYAKINLVPEIQRVSGVGQVIAFGARDYSMRVWLKPDRLAANNLSPQEVLGAIKEQNLEAAPGRFGERSNESFEYLIKYKGKLNLGEQYENMILKANSDGTVLRLKDVARVEFGSFSYTVDNKMGGKTAIGIAVFQTAGSNANDIQVAINNVLKKNAAFFPTGIEYFNIYSTKEYLDESISQVKETLAVAFALVFLVVFIFLQDFRSTLIPAIAVPVAITGTFFFMQLFGFTLNLLTLFALVLAIGIVVDDAIVVVEAVHSKMERTGLPAREATIESMKEISGAIISITMVMAAVFVPVGFMQGPSGVFYRQFAFTLAIAILISAVNALTLSPALSALFLKNIHAGEGEHKVRKSFAGRFFSAFNTGFTAITEKYSRVIKFFARYKWIPVSALLIISLITYWMMKQTPTGFIPAEDQNFVVYNVTLPASSSLERTKEVTNKIEKLLKSMEPVETFFSVTGFNLFSNSNSSNYAVGFVRLKSFNARGNTKKLQDVMQLMNGRFSGIKEANIITFTFPTVPGFGNVEGFEMILQDRANGPLDKLGNTTNNFIGELMKRKEIALAFTTYYTGNPQYLLEVNEIKAKQLGISVNDILQTLQLYYGSAFASDFNRFGKFYRVIVQADVEYRANPATLNNIYVKNSYGQMVPTNTLMSLKKVYGPETVTRNNLFNSVTINGFPKPGY